MESSIKDPNMNMTITDTASSFDEKTEVKPYAYDRRERKLDPGDNIVRKRQRWYQIWLPKHDAPPPRLTLAEAPIIPLASASWLSILTFSWITPIMDLGYARTLQATDLYAMDQSRTAAYLGSKLDEAWATRVEKAKAWNAKLDGGEVQPWVTRRLQWWISRNVGNRFHPGKGEKARRTNKEEQERVWRQNMRRSPSLAWALNDVLGHRFWPGGYYKVFGDLSQLMAPLVVRAIITFGQKHFDASHPTPGAPPPKAPPIVEGVFMAVGLFILSNFQNFGQQHFFWRSMTTGVLARTALISSVYKRGVYLAPSARKEYDNSKLLHFVSGDISRIDAASQWFHAAWTAPIQITICLIILLTQLGPTALIGFALFVLLVPFQEFLMKRQYRVRKVTSEWSDQRMSLLTECFSGMKVVKWFCYENRFLERISRIRANELKGVWKIEINGSVNLAVAFSVPVLAAVLSFTAYLLTAHDFNIAIIFSSLTLFNLLRQPLMFLPRAISSIADAQSALKRLTPLFESPLSDTTGLDVDYSLPLAVAVDGASFAWEESIHEKQRKQALAKPKSKRRDAETPADAKSISPFQLHDISMKVERSTVVAIVGPVGSGKSSLLQGLVGEMRKTGGTIKFGGKVAYCSQVAWIQNTTLRENILFGQPYEPERYWQALGKASLMPDLQVLPEGDLTEIGEKGINLSGGQKQRVNIARALYCNADIVIMDDPLSAVDAHVGKALFHDAILNTLRAGGKTVILVTHALHFISEVDYVYTLLNGRIAEHGTYSDLMASKKEFFRLLSEHGGNSKDQRVSEGEESEITREKESGTPQSRPTDSRKAGPTEMQDGALTTKEKRTTGSVSWRIYAAYIRAGKGYMTAPLVILSAVMMQTSQILNSYVLVWWQANSFNLPETTYAFIYAMLGVGQALFTFTLGVTMAALARTASHELHSQSVNRIFHAPSSFFDTTPLGRLVSVFGKDFDSIDNQLTTSLRMLALTISTCLGAVIIVTILEHYFLIAAFIIGIGYNYMASFYGASSREMKRLDAMTRSLLYAHFSESLTGLPTLKAYGVMKMFTSDNEYYVDLENRALFLTTTNQRWLSVRLGFLGSIMTFIVALFAVAGTSGISPAQIGLILTYTTSLTQMLTVVTRQSTDVENYMNAVERVVQYSRGDITESEAAHEIPEQKPPKEWPTDGSVEFNDVEMAYRKGLPTVLKGVSLTIAGGEKLGVVGRTGAGKSSLVMALFRIMELSSGSIKIDDLDISKLGLQDLRSSLSIIPQEPLLFSGTIRSNLDPFSLYHDAHLWDALRRSYLIEMIPRKDDMGFAEPASALKFNLESVVEPEGLNMSVGERSLLSLARALVKDSRIVILDEATASVDLETDAKIQRTIQTEFSGKTLICIAHRLRTILSYDRILVMDAGQVAELDSPLNLYDRENGIFRGMCDRSNITRVDIEKANL